MSLSRCVCVRRLLEPVKIYSVSSTGGRRYKTKERPAETPSIPAISYEAALKVPKFFEEVLKVESRVDRRKPKIQPFVVNFFASKVDTEVLAYPEILNKEELNALDGRLDKIDNVIGDLDATDESIIETFKKQRLFSAPLTVFDGGLESNYTEKMRFLEEIARFRTNVALELNTQWSGIEAIKCAVTDETFKSMSKLLIDGEHSLRILYRERISENLDLPDVRLAAKMDRSGQWRLNGEKLVENILGLQPNNEFLVVLASIQHHLLQGFLVNPNAPGVTYNNDSSITFVDTPANRPDIVLVDHSKHTTYIVDVTIPHDENLQKAERDKILKYMDLAHEIKDMWRTPATIVVPIVISTNGLIPKSLHANLCKVGVDGGLKYLMQKAVLLSTCRTLPIMLGEDILEVFTEIAKSGKGQSFPTTPIQKGLTHMRLGEATIALGLLKEAMVYVLSQVKGKYFSNKNYCELGVFEDLLTDASTVVYKIESMVYMAAGLQDGYEDPDIELEAILCRIFATRETVRILNQFLSNLTPFGIQGDLEAYLDDAKSILYKEQNDNLTIYSTLLGMRHAGFDLKDVVTKLRNPALNPYFVVKKLLKDRKQSKDDPELTLQLKDYFHQSLMDGADDLEYCIFRLSYAVENAFTHHAKDIVYAHRDLRRLNDAVIEIFAMVASLSRCSRSYCIGVRNCNRELLQCSLIAINGKTFVKQKVLEIAGGKYLNMDESLSSLGQDTVQMSRAPAEHPLTRVFF